jgi:hypothetical protein
MQNTHLFVAAAAARVGGPANPSLRSETWGTRLVDTLICGARIWGGGEGRTISTLAVRV